MERADAIWQREHVVLSQEMMDWQTTGHTQASSGQMGRYGLALTVG
jgi:hypothetical protein